MHAAIAHGTAKSYPTAHLAAAMRTNKRVVNVPVRRFPGCCTTRANLLASSWRSVPPTHTSRGRLGHVLSGGGCREAAGMRLLGLLFRASPLSNLSPRHLTSCADALPICDHLQPKSQLRTDKTARPPVEISSRQAKMVPCGSQRGLSRHPSWLCSAPRFEPVGASPGRSCKPGPCTVKLSVVSGDCGKHNAVSWMKAFLLSRLGCQRHWHAFLASQAAKLNFPARVAA